MSSSLYTGETRLDNIGSNGYPFPHFIFISICPALFYWKYFIPRERLFLESITLQKYININYSLLLKLLLAGALLSLFLGLYHHQALVSFLHSLECLFFLSYGEVSITEIKFLFPLLLWLLPQVVLFYFIGSELGTDLERNAVYIFTRSQQRKEWLLAKSLTLFIYILVYFSVQFLVLWAFAAIQGIHLVDQQQGLVLILSLLSLLVLT